MEQEFFAIGKVIKPHGIHGRLWVRTYGDSGDAFAQTGRVFLGGEDDWTPPLAVLSVQPHHKGFLLALEGIESRDQAEMVRGASVFVEVSRLPREEGVYFWEELIGLEVQLTGGEVIGRICRIVPTGGHDLYVVGKGEGEVFLPAVPEVIQQIDPEQGIMIVSPPEGLLELNAV